GVRPRWRRHSIVKRRRAGSSEERWPRSAKRCRISKGSGKGSPRSAIAGRSTGSGVEDEDLLLGRGDLLGSFAFLRLQLALDLLILLHHSAGLFGQPGGLPGAR